MEDSGVESCQIISIQVNVRRVDIIACKIEKINKSLINISFNLCFVCTKESAEIDWTNLTKSRVRAKIEQVDGRCKVERFAADGSDAVEGQVGSSQISQRRYLTGYFGQQVVTQVDVTQRTEAVEWVKENVQNGTHSVVVDVASEAVE